MRTLLGAVALFIAFSVGAASLDRYKEFLNGTQSARAAFEQGDYEAALAGFIHAAERNTAFDRIVAFGQGALAAAHCGKVELVESFQNTGRAQIGSETQSFDCARFFLWSAEAWQILGQDAKVDALLIESLKVAEGKDFHEVQIKAEALMARTKATVRRDPKLAWEDADSGVKAGLSRLVSLSTV